MLGPLGSHLLGGGLAWLNLIRGSGPTSGPPWNFTAKAARMRLRSILKFRDRELNPGLVRDAHKYEPLCYRGGAPKPVR